MSELCPKRQKCPLFPLFESKHALEAMKTLYCESATGRWQRCARFCMAEQGTMPPPTLLPDGRHLDRVEGPSEREKVAEGAE